MRVFRRHVALAGLIPTIRKTINFLKLNGFGGLRNQVTQHTPHSGESSVVLKAPRAGASEFSPGTVLLVSEISIPQCLKYRVVQKQRMIESLGYQCQYIDWRKHAECMDALQLCGTVIFYRVPAFPDVMALIAEAKRLKVISYWEVDDLIFDPVKYADNSNLRSLDDATIKSLLDGVVLYRNAMLACDRAIASTSGLADAMRDAGVKDVRVIENGLDEETQVTADQVVISERRRPGNEGVVIVYGSGTKTHDADFLEAARGIYGVIKKFPNVSLRIIGELTLPDYYSDIYSRVELYPFSDYAGYLSNLAQCDISIAPLEDSIFNDAKSNIKFLEAAIVRLPSVCSPRAAFRGAISHQVDGFLASTPEEWEHWLTQLVKNASLRKMVGDAARVKVIECYSPKNIAATQVAAALPDLPAGKKLRVLSANIFFAPRSFGGATIVAEQMTKLLGMREDLEQFVLTSLPTDTVSPYHFKRYEAQNAAVIGLGLPDHLDPVSDFENKAATHAFETILKSITPDLVHLHSVQGLGITFAEMCRELNIPYVVTLHDAWWICGRQFMINNRGVYCGQKTIDLKICAQCVDNPTLNEYRQHRLRTILNDATRLVVPSEFTRQLYAANGFDAGRIHLNKNGVRSVGARYARSRSEIIRFGYVGGNTPIKGIHLIVSAFNKITRTDYELVVVDNLLNLGRRSFSPDSIDVPGIVKIIPGYTQDSIDDFFANIDVLLFPTQWKETFGLTVREALIRDVWVISTDAGGTVEDIVAGENGTIIPLSGDDQYLVGALNHILGEKQKYLNHINKHKDKVWLFDNQAADLLSVYELSVSRDSSRGSEVGI